MTDKHLNAIQSMMTLYFDGLYQADTRILAQVFHPEARYINTLPSDYLNLSVTDYFAMVEQRTPPAATKEKRHDRVIAIELGSDNMAFVKATMQMMGKDYLDYLTLIKQHDTWQIITKVFSYQAITETP